ncbi:MAG: hypothetical protein LBQ74_17765 [Prevotella sp.]|jgi:hypothetical protein|nr:hypothetical protein [Prevotella sp.]
MTEPQLNNIDKITIDPIDLKFESDHNYNNGKSRPNIDVDNLGIEEQKDLFKKRYLQDTAERKLLSHWVIGVVSIWLLLVVAILCLNRLLDFKLSDTVLCMLLGTTTINILGLAYIVLKGLFDSKK